MATIIYISGETKEISPVNGTDFKLEEVKAIVGGYVEVVNLPDGRLMIVNECGKLDGLLRNEAATKLAELPTPQERLKYRLIMEELGYSVIDATGNEEDYIAGDVLICRDDEFR